MFSERDHARPDPPPARGRSARTVDRDLALTLGTMLALLGAAGSLYALVSAMTLGQGDRAAAYAAGLVAFFALGCCFELIRRVSRLERRLSARDRLDRRER